MTQPWNRADPRQTRARSTIAFRAVRTLAIAGLLTFAVLVQSAQPAAAAGFPSLACEYGRACLRHSAPPQAGTGTVWNADGCGFHNLNDEGLSDWAGYFVTHGNQIHVGNYLGSGDTHNRDNFTWWGEDGWYPAWSEGWLRPYQRGVVDAIYVYC